MRILIASEDAPMASTLAILLRAIADEIEIAQPGFLWMEPPFVHKADLLVLDIRKENGRGPGLVSAIREAAPLCALLVLGERASPALRSEWLKYGADDCLGKPFSLGELRARCGALLRRQQAVEAVLSLPGGLRDALRAAPETSALGGLQLDRLRRLTVCGGVSVRLTEREAALLEQLMLASGAVVSRRVLREAFRQIQTCDSQDAGANVVDVHIAAVRRKLQGSPGAPAIQTVRGVGYRMVAGVIPLEVPAAVCAARAPSIAGAFAAIGR